MMFIVSESSPYLVMEVCTHCMYLFYAALLESSIILYWESRVYIYMFISIICFIYLVYSS